MKRRAFFKYSSLVLPAAAGLGMAGSLPGKILAATKASESFSLSVITDKPSKTIHMIEQAIKNSRFSKNTLEFDEYNLEGRHIGDIAFLKSDKLIDFRKSNDDFSLLLDESANILSLPRSLDNPVMLKFSSLVENAEADNISIFRGENLVKQLKLNSDVDNYRIEGLKGHVDIRIKDKSVKIISSTCTHKTCMNMNPISRSGENLVCIPNQVSISVSGKNFWGVDAITF